MEAWGDVELTRKEQGGFRASPRDVELPCNQHGMDVRLEPQLLSKASCCHMQIIIDSNQENLRESGSRSSW